jgi:hypothetical protein
LGHTVNFRSTKESYKDKHAKENPKENWMIFENTHPAIIHPETWEAAQRSRKTIRRTDSTGEANPLTGLVFCAQCGAKMYNHRRAKASTYVHPKGWICNIRPRDLYNCSTYSLSSRRFNKKCTQHHIRTDVIRQLVLEAIKSVSNYARDNEAEFVKQLREASILWQESAAKSHRKQLAKAEKHHAKLDKIIRNLYGDKVSGALSDKRFETLSAGYEREQSELETRIETLSSEIESFDADSIRADKFMELVRRYTDFSELTPTMLLEFVEKIMVHEADYTSGEREQAVDIYLNFIGKFDVYTEPTPEEIVAEEKARAKRKKYRDAQLSAPKISVKPINPERTRI